MLRKEEIEKIILNLKKSFLYSEGIPGRMTKGCYYIADHTKSDLDNIFKYIEQLETENRRLKVGINGGLDKDKKNCFYEDGHTGKCLGYGDDEPCDYCKNCEKLSIKEDD